MTYIVATIRGLFSKQKGPSTDPVFKFFYETSSAKRKKVYVRVLRKVQSDQEKISKTAREKVRA